MTLTEWLVVVFLYTNIVVVTHILQIIMHRLSLSIIETLQQWKTPVFSLISFPLTCDLKKYYCCCNAYIIDSDTQT